MSPRRKATALLIALTALAAPSVLASTYCGTSIGGCAGGATVSGEVEISGPSCVWTCVAPDNSTTRCTSGTLSDPCVGLNIPDKVEANTGFVRDGEDTFDAYRPHNPDIAHTMAGDSIRICSHRVDSQDDIDALAPYATRFSWGWPTSPTYAALQPDLGDACYQYTPGTSHRPLFTRTEAEFHSFLEWALARDNAADPGAVLEVDSMCLYLYESDTTRRSRYVAASPAGEHTNLLGDNWIDANTAGDCPCEQEPYECGEACPTLASGAVIDGLLCGLPSCFANLASHWGPAPSTVCSGVSFTQTNACDNTTRSATGTDASPGCSSTPPQSCTGTWGPEPSTVCDGDTFTQTCSSDGTLTRSATGTNASVCPVCTGTWDPAPGTVCDGTDFTQTCSTDSSLSRNATGTDTTSSACVCPGGWDPAPSTVCDGLTFTQTCLSDATLTQQATGTLRGCPPPPPPPGVRCCPDTRGRLRGGGARSLRTVNPRLVHTMGISLGVHMPVELTVPDLQRCQSAWRRPIRRVRLPLPDQLAHVAGRS